MYKKNKQIIFTVIIALVAGLILCEVILRIVWNLQILKMDNLGVISYDFMRELSDPGLPFELKPNLDLRIRNYHIVTNSDGFRDKEYVVEKPSDTVRILVLGDSITFGFGIEKNEDVYHAVLERKLNDYARDISFNKRFEVIGMAAPGYNTYIELSLLKKKGLKYNPNVVVFAYCLNDMRDAVYSYEYARGLSLGYSNPSILRLPPLIKRNLRRSIFYSYLANAANRLRSYINAKRQSHVLREEISAKETPTSEAFVPLALKASSPKISLYCPEGSAWHDIYTYSHKGKYLEIVDQFILNDLEKLSKRHNFKVVFVIFPAFEKHPSYFPEGERYLFEEGHMNLKRLFEKHDFYTLDLKEYLHGMPFNEIAMDDCHLTLNGHLIVGGIVFNNVKENFINKSD